MSIILKGIDVSTHQGNVNWSVVKNHVDFAILRAGYGRLVSQQDAQFVNNYTGCKSNNIPCGAYWYSYAMNEDDAVLEAKAFWKFLKEKLLNIQSTLILRNQNSLHWVKQCVPR